MIDEHRALVRFVVFAAPRTGSNWLCTLLQSHPQILCHHELFNPDRIIYSIALRDGQLDLGAVSDRDANAEGFIERVWTHRFDHPIVGFKLNRDQTPQAFDVVFQHPTIRVILLRRRNRLRTFLSERIALRTGGWESYAWSDVPRKRVTIAVDPEELRQHAERNAKYFDWLRANLRQHDVIESWYESLADPKEHQRLLRFLGAEPASARLEAATSKMNPTRIEDLVTNHDALCSALRDTEFEADLSAPNVR